MGPASRLAPPPADPKFEPFIRTDAYGEGGFFVGPLRALRVAILSVTLLPARMVAALFCVAGYYVLLRLLHVLPEGVLVRRMAAFWGRFWSTACLLALGFVRIRWVAVRDGAPPPPAREQRPPWQVAIVSNHISWADILIHMSRALPSFVARDGTQNIKMVGLIRCARARARARGAWSAGVQRHAGSRSTASGRGSAAADCPATAAACGLPGGLPRSADSAPPPPPRAPRRRCPGSRRIECIYVDREKKNGSSTPANVRRGAGRGGGGEPRESCV
jgi:hypothetical protein